MNAIQKIDPRQATIRSYFERSKGALEKVATKHLSADRLIRVALAATSRTPRLLECTPQSLLQAVMWGAQLGLEAGGPLGHLYLVPFLNRKARPPVMEVTPIVGYRGLLALVRRSGEILGVEARVVHEADTFELDYGLAPRLVHRPTMAGAPGALTAAYAIARLKDGGNHVEVMTRAEIDGIRARSKGDGGPWVTDFDEMARKTVVRRLCKYLPISVEAAEAIEMDDRAVAPVAVPIVEKALGEGAPSAGAISAVMNARGGLPAPTAGPEDFGGEDFPSTVEAPAAPEVKHGDDPLAVHLDRIQRAASHEDLDAASLEIREAGLAGLPSIVTAFETRLDALSAGLNGGVQ